MPEYMPPTKWEPSIVNSDAYDDLTRLLCDLIFHQIGGEPPSEGAKFEIEAKLGEIQSRDEHARLRFPVMSETLLSTDNLSLPATRFESSMDFVSPYPVHVILTFRISYSCCSRYNTSI